MKTKTFPPWIILTTTLLFCSSKTFAQGGVPLWTNLNKIDYPKFALDSSGKLFVTGRWEEDSHGHYEFGTVGYSAAGMPLWTNIYSYNGAGSNYDQPTGIVADYQGNVIVTGESGTAIGSLTGSDYTTIKYSNAGIPLWTNRYNGSGNGDDEPRAVAVDSSGNVFVTGGAAEINYDYVTIKYSGAGVPIWTNRYDGPASADDFGEAILADSSGNVFVTGDSYGTSSGQDYATIAYSGAGVPLWTNRYSGPGNGADYVGVFKMDNNGNPIVSGTAGTIAYSSAGVPLWTNTVEVTAVDNSGNLIVTDTSQNGTNYYYETIKLSSAGVPLWTNLYQISPGYLSQTAVDKSGNVFVTGDGGTIAYSGAGVLLWTNLNPGTSIAVDSGGNVFVAEYALDIQSSVITKYSSSILAPPHLDFQWLNNRLVLNWTNATFNLQSAPDLTSTFTNIPNATSPFTNPIAAPQQFFRLISP